MSRPAKTLERVLSGRNDANTKFADLRALLTHLGFRERIRGDHHIFTREGVEEVLNLQPRGADAKPYQVRQVRNVITTYGLAGVQDEAEGSGGE
jgi:hypothetical protein